MTSSSRGDSDNVSSGAPSRSVQLPGDPANPRKSISEYAMKGVLGNAITAVRFASAEGFRDGMEIGITESMAYLSEQAEAINRSDFKDAEAMLAGQATALNAMFNECARRAALNMGQHLEATESYMRMAMKAQAQSRATWETLAAIKNPPVVYARQANFANGPQQVNNGAPTHAAPQATAPTKLLEKMDGERLDFGATAAAGGTHSQLETVGALHRTADSGGQGAMPDEPIPRRQAGKRAGVPSRHPKAGGAQPKPGNRGDRVS